MVHTDVGSLTLLFYSLGLGLEDFYYNGTWISMPPPLNKIIIGVGDALSLARGLRLKS